jgi:surface protein
MMIIFWGYKFNGDISQWNVSNVEEMVGMFRESVFTGDISKWNVSNVKNMSVMFYFSLFNGDISKWDISNLKRMAGMFGNSVFNGDISMWDVSKVEDMNWIFMDSIFSHDLNHWKPYSLNQAVSAYDRTNAPIPYWYDSSGIGEPVENIGKAIDSYWLSKELDKDLNNNSELNEKRVKI